MRNGQAYQRKTEKFSISEEKKFGKIDSWIKSLAAHLNIKQENKHLNTVLVAVFSLFFYSNIKTGK